MDRFLEERGYDGLTPYHADRIFRQNMLTAYSVGHYQQMTDPDVTERRKYWQYQTAGDGHVRESHAAMDGRVFPSGFPGVGYLVSAQRVPGAGVWLSPGPRSR